MDSFNIPIIHLEKNMDKESISHEQYTIVDLSGAIYFVQAFTRHMFQECFVLFAVENSGVKPIHIQIVTEPQGFVPYRLCTQKMYRTAIASNADAVILLHNSPVRIAD